MRQENWHPNEPAKLIPPRKGFLTAIQHTLRLKPGGLVTAGPPCGSFIFLNMGTSGRSKLRPLGCRRNYVQVANETLGVHPHRVVIIGQLGNDVQ